MVYLIQGFFFQPTQTLGVSYREGGAAAVIREGMGRFPFFGAVFPLTNPPSFWWEGDMNDDLGPSKITDWTLGPFRITFTKIYLNGSGRGSSSPIRYGFKKQADGTWIGTYGGERCGQGHARCIITEVGDDFFRVPTPESSAA